MTDVAGIPQRAMDQTFQTNELRQSGRPVDYRIWFKVADGSRISIEMSLSGLLSLRGLVDRAIATFEGMAPEELNGARAGVSEVTKAEAA